MVCINKFVLNPDEKKRPSRLCKGKKHKVMGKIPFDPGFNQAMVYGKTIMAFDTGLKGREAVKNIWITLLKDTEN
jgi:MinD superfamily P-loop ATPase